jgi:hypothetical protein
MAAGMVHVTKLTPGECQPYMWGARRASKEAEEAPGSRATATCACCSTRGRRTPRIPSCTVRKYWYKVGMQFTQMIALKAPGGGLFQPLEPERIVITWFSSLCFRLGPLVSLQHGLATVMQALAAVYAKITIIVLAEPENNNHAGVVVTAVDAAAINSVLKMPSDVAHGGAVQVEYS